MKLNAKLCEGRRDSAMVYSEPESAPPARITRSAAASATGWDIVTPAATPRASSPLIYRAVGEDHCLLTSMLDAPVLDTLDPRMDEIIEQCLATGDDDVPIDIKID